MDPTDQPMVRILTISDHELNPHCQVTIRFDGTRWREAQASARKIAERLTKDMWNTVRRELPIVPADPDETKE